MKQDERQIEEVFGMLLKRHRMKKGYTLGKLEEMSGVGKSYISRIENEQRKSPSYKVVKTLANILDIDLEEAEESLRRQEQDISDLLINSRYSINGETVTLQVKELIISLIDNIMSSNWQAERTKNVLEVAEIIDRLSNELNIKSQVG